MSAPAPAPAAAPIPAPSRAPLPPPASAPAPAPTAAPLALPTAAPRPACVAHPPRSTSTATQPLVVLRIFIPLETHIESGRRCTKGATRGRDAPTTSVTRGKTGRHGGRAGALLGRPLPGHVRPHPALREPGEGAGGGGAVGAPGPSRPHRSHRD